MLLNELFVSVFALTSVLNKRGIFKAFVNNYIYKLVVNSSRHSRVTKIAEKCPKFGDICFFHLLRKKLPKKFICSKNYTVILYI
jgi:hypothetical protein